VGVAKQVSSRWDISVDYSYSQYYALGGEYNPKTFSVGAVFHFVKR
jgi:opacity protein-like surface antigen